MFSSEKNKFAFCLALNKEKSSSNFLYLFLLFFFFQNDDNWWQVGRWYGITNLVMTWWLGWVVVTKWSKCWWRHIEMVPNALPFLLFHWAEIQKGKDAFTKTYVHCLKYWHVPYSRDTNYAIKTCARVGRQSCPKNAHARITREFFLYSQDLRRNISIKWK